ncbi:MAG: glutathione S-transferase family protein [Polyangiaceae bacterium]|nr:glutathione S-transferase family protein [Polyangiaceae bacterium]
MLIVHDFDASPNCLKTKILLYELGIPFEQRSVDRPILQSAAYRAKFPTGFAPAIEDGEVRLSESGAIALYLAEKHNKLMPSSNAGRSKMLQAMFVEAAILSPTVGGQGLFGELFRPEAERNLPRITDLRVKVQHVGHVLGELLGDASFFAGEFSIADIQLYAATAKTLESGTLEAPPKNLVAWRARMTDRPAVARAREEYVHYRRQA